MPAFAGETGDSRRGERVGGRMLRREGASAGEDTSAGENGPAGGTAAAGENGPAGEDRWRLVIPARAGDATLALGVAVLGIASGLGARAQGEHVRSAAIP